MEEGSSKCLPCWHEEMVLDDPLHRLQSFFSLGDKLWNASDDDIVAPALRGREGLALSLLSGRASRLHRELDGAAVGTVQEDSIFTQKLLKSGHPLDISVLTSAMIAELTLQSSKSWSSDSMYRMLNKMLGEEQVLLTAIQDGHPVGVVPSERELALHGEANEEQIQNWVVQASSKTELIICIS